MAQNGAVSIIDCLEKPLVAVLLHLREVSLESYNQVLLNF